LNPFRIVSEFEKALAVYAGAKYGVAVDSCTSALFLCCKYLDVDTVTLPCNTFISVPCAVMNAGGHVRFDDIEWSGCYRLTPYSIVDSALRFTKGMYQPGTLYCLSFHHKKQLSIGRGGMILTDDAAAVNWLRRARYFGRGECELVEDTVQMVGWKCYMDPAEAARGLHAMLYMPDHNEDQRENYPDLSTFTDSAGRPLYR